jgi:uncharacterized membrane protein YcaP (DUF421 family)
MDPLRIVVRVVFAFAVALIFTRIAGARTVKQGDTPSFVIALVIGDQFDDLFWAEVSAAQFAVAAGTLFLVHVIAEVQNHRSGHRRWRAAEK